MHGAAPFWYGLFPPEWYRYNRVAKGRPSTILFLFGAVFAVAVATFVILSIVGSHKTITQSVVSATDTSGTNGWSCEMVSKVTDRYTLNGGEGTSFTLVNTLESQPECLHALNSVPAPCDGLVYNSSASTSFVGVGALFTNDASSGDFIFYGSNGVSLYRYGVESGDISTVFAAELGNDDSPSPQDIAFDSKSNLYYLLDSVGGTDTVRVYDPTTRTFSNVSTFDDGCVDGSIAVDTDGVLFVGRVCYTNYINIYKIQDGTRELYGKVDAQFSVGAQLSATSGGGMFLALYIGGNVKVNNVGFYNDVDGSFEAMFYWSLSSELLSSVHTAVDASGSILLSCAKAGMSWFDQEGNVLQVFDPRTPSSTDLGTDNQNAVASLSLTSSLAVDASGGVYLSSDLILYRMDSRSLELADAKSFAGSSAWFICGDALQSAVPASTADLLSACPLNGVKWEVDFAGKVFFSEAAMAAQATTGAGAAACSPQDNYIAICDVVSDLPPYICTRELPPAAVSYLGSAAGGAHLLYACLVVLISGALTVTSSSEAAEEHFRLTGGGGGGRETQEPRGSSTTKGFSLVETTVETPLVHPTPESPPEAQIEGIVRLKDTVAELQRAAASQSELIRAQAASISSLEASMRRLLEAEDKRANP